MQHERLFKVSSLFFSLGTCFFPPLTPFCLCVGTFHIQLTTTHPLTHPSLSFQSVLCFVLILFLLFFLGFFAQSVSLLSHVRHIMQLQFRTAALLCALTFLLVKLCITAGGKSLKNAKHCSVMRIRWQEQTGVSRPVCPAAAPGQETEVWDGLSSCQVHNKVNSCWLPWL